MNFKLASFTLIVTVFLIAHVPAADRVVVYEHFSQDQCSSCPAVAAVIEQFRSDYDRNSVAIISYSIQGSDPVPEGQARLNYFGQDNVPYIVGDGMAELPPALEYQHLVSHYNNRKNAPSPLFMDVIREAPCQYRVRLTAESGVSAVWLPLPMKILFMMMFTIPVTPEKYSLRSPA